MNATCHLLWTTVDNDWLKERYHQLLGILPERLITRLAKYPTLEDQYLSLTGKLLLAKGLQLYGIDAATAFHSLVYSSKGRPCLEGFDVDFNISHSGNLVVCALSAGARIGIDIQRRIAITKAKASLFVSPADLAAINFETRSGSLIDIWTRKEAASKLVGDGLSISFKNMLFNEGNYTFENQTIFLYPVDLHQQYACSLASSRTLDHIQVQPVALENLMTETTIHAS